VIILFHNRAVYHLTASPQTTITLCGASAWMPYRLRSGEWCTAYAGGSPFPTRQAAPPSDRRPCKACQAVLEGRRRAA